jgi:GH24 family phage-related lysozyme (muramidase)
MSSFSEQRREMIKEGEGCIRHMYLDTVGKVTVAVGQMMPTAGEAEKLSFIRRSNGTPATAAEIRADYESVAKQTSGQIAFSYKQFTQLDMPEQAIDALLDRRIDEFEAGLRRDFPGYDSYPDQAKLGLMDMAFNLGNQGLIEKFSTFTRAARTQDWRTCADECQRRGISQLRNDMTKRLFEEAATAAGQ